MRYIIIGAGAVGTSLAAQFDEAGVETLLVGLGAQLAHLRAHGLSYQRPEGTISVPLRVTDLAGLALRQGDVLVLTVKTQDVEETGAVYAGLAVEGGGVGADLPIVALQNGLAAERILARRFDRVYSASVKVPAIYTETGKVRVLARPQFASFLVGRYPGGTDAITAALVADLRKANALAEERTDIQRWKADKLLHNVKNALELFSGDAEERGRIGADVTAEAARVLRGSGYDLPREEERAVSIAHWQIRRDANDPGGQSTWQSFTRGARSEVDFLNGEIVLLAQLHGLEAPLNRAVQRLAARLAQEGGKPGDIALDRLVSLAH